MHGEIRLSDLVKALAPYGVTLEPPSSGSHFKLKREGYRCYTIPTNGWRGKIPSQYIKSACKTLGIPFDEVDPVLYGEKTGKKAKDEE